LPTDLQLLELEIETQWPSSNTKRLIGERAPLMVLGVTAQGWTSAYGTDVSDPLGAKLDAAVAANPPTSVPRDQPESLARCRELLKRLAGAAEISGGPSYLIQPSTRFGPSGRIVRSTDGETALLETQDCLRLNWPADEWDHLLRGALGPWAMAVVDDEVASICHSARLTDRGAEAGVWTAPDFRGRGLAASATAAWAGLLEGTGRHLFYSTLAGNLSSQRVAQRLRLQPIGWMWKITRASNPT
jgi:hypothetical protein